MTESAEEKMRQAKQARDAQRASLREERRAARREMLQSGPASPCIAVCQYDENLGWCVGCYRTLDEIRDWPITMPDDRRTILEHCARRRSGGFANPG